MNTQEPPKGGYTIDAVWVDEFSQPAQEPLGYIGVITLQRIKSNYSGIDGYGISLEKLLENDIPLYTHPAPSWQGLSDDEVHNYADHNFAFASEHFEEIFNFYRAIEQALKEKNHG